MGYSLIDALAEPAVESLPFICHVNRVVPKGTGTWIYRIILSAKYWDADIKLYYYGYRYLSQGMGRWLNRDAIGENGGWNLYNVYYNDFIGFVDFLGLSASKEKPELGDYIKCPCKASDIEETLIVAMVAAATKTRTEKLSYKMTVDGVTAVIEFEREFCGYICCSDDGETVTYTGPKPGSWGQKDGSYKDDPFNGAHPSCGNVTQSGEANCPEKTKAVIFYHSHPHGLSDFSKGDVNWSRKNVPIALMPSDGNLIKVGVPGRGTIEVPLPVVPQPPPHAK